MLNPDLTAELSTVSRLKSGGFRDKFAINITNTNGADLFHGNSGGEQRLIDIALSLAFSRYFRSVSTGSIDVLFLDEIFDSLDSAATERVVDLLRTIEMGNVFVISHKEELKDMIPNRIVVEKKNGVATVNI
jgi:DNA repair exonuclease SbcCD ATPase subunit